MRPASPQKPERKLNDEIKAFVTMFDFRFDLLTGT